MKGHFILLLQKLLEFLKQAVQVIFGPVQAVLSRLLLPLCNNLLVVLLANAFVLLSPHIWCLTLVLWKFGPAR